MRRGWCGIFSLVDGAAIPGGGGGAASLTEEERGLVERTRLMPEQIGYRRRIRADFRGLTAQEFAEDEESCFLASGESVFELAAVEARLETAPEPVKRRRNGELEIWLPPVKGKEYLVSVDPAGGGSDGDYSAAQVLELESGLQCAEFAGHVGGLELARLVTDLARSTTEHGWWWSGITMAAACWRWQNGLQVRADLPAGRAGGLAYDEREPAGNAGTAGRGAGGGAGAVPEPAAAGRVPELCAHGEWPLGSAGGDARRPGDGHGDGAGGKGGTRGSRSKSAG